MARIVAFVPDLLFGSQVQGALRAAGHQVELASDAATVRRLLADSDLLVVDLTDDAPARTRALAEVGALGGRDAQTPGPLGDRSHGEGTPGGLGEGGPGTGAPAAIEETRGAIRTLAFYSHVEAQTRAAAERAGFDAVVPRSRMAREGPELVARLIG